MQSHFELFFDHFSAKKVEFSDDGWVTCTMAVTSLLLEFQIWIWCSSFNFSNSAVRPGSRQPDHTMVWSKQLFDHGIFQQAGSSCRFCGSFRLRPCSLWQVYLKYCFHGCYSLTSPPLTSAGALIALSTIAAHRRSVALQYFPGWYCILQ